MVKPAQKLSAHNISPTLSGVYQWCGLMVGSNGGTWWGLSVKSYGGGGGLLRRGGVYR